MEQDRVSEKRVARYIKVALSLSSLLLIVNPLVLGLFLHLDPDAALYILTWDLIFIVLLAASVAFIRTTRLRYRRMFMLALLAAPFLLIGSELYLSQWRIRSVDAWHPQTIEGVHESHPELGWRPIPNGRGRHISEGNFDARYEIDELGRKAIPISFDGAPALHFFGDSYSFGHGADNEDTALNVLARGFAKERGFNVANYAAMGYGLEQMLTGLKIHEEQIHAGDYVIFVPTSFDLSRNMIHKRFLCSFPIRKNTPVGGLMMRENGDWTRVSLDEACGPAENLFLQANFAFGLFYHSVRDRSLRPALVENADAIFAEARKISEKAGATFVLLFLAAPWECGKASYDFGLSELDTEHGSMLEHCPELNLRFPSDSHWSPEGHRWVAEFLGQQLEPVLRQKNPSR